jgi:ABC-type transport system substrate-binding protein
MDWQTLVARRTKKDPADKGGWHIFFTSSGALSIPDPVANFFLNASCEKSMYGWPCDADIEKLRAAYARETDDGKRREIAQQAQYREIEYPTYVQLGQFTVPTAVRSNVIGLRPAPPLPSSENAENSDCALVELHGDPLRSARGDGASSPRECPGTTISIRPSPRSACRRPPAASIR